MDRGSCIEIDPVPFMHAWLLFIHSGLLTQIIINVGTISISLSAGVSPLIALNTLG